MKLSKNLVECFYVDDDTNILNIDTQLDENFKLFYLKNNEVQKVEKLIEVSQNPQLMFSRNKSLKKRAYYAVQQNNETLIPFGERILPIAGMFNFRDIGGYPTTFGKRVKWGRIYRGDQLCNLKDEGLEYVENLEISSIIDLRSNNEVTEYPNKKVGKSVKTFHLDPNAPIAELSAELMDGSVNSEKIEKHVNPNVSKNEMIQQQIRFVNEKQSKKVFSTMLKAIIENPQDNFFIHCRGGKDRTGYAIMLILGLLGVPTNYLVYDYMLTNVSRKEKNIAYWNRFYQKTKDVTAANFLYGLYETDETYILASINEICLKYDGFENYAITQLGISFEEIEALRLNFLYN